ncbi:MAG: hypothetical protein KAS66_03460 [Candidatus Omnitrophica bacterium]|nr:hypothetical protein [Candidatus Omnitrophota bacterium]
MTEIKACPIPDRINKLFSAFMYLLTPLALGFAYYLLLHNLTGFPFILLASLFYGFGCLGLKGMWELRNNESSFCF